MIIPLAQQVQRRKLAQLQDDFSTFQGVLNAETDDEMKGAWQQILDAIRQELSRRHHESV